MKNISLILPLIFIVLLISCSDHPSKKANSPQKKLIASATNAVKKPVIIDIIPYNDVPLGLTNYIFSEFIKIYPNARLLKSIPLPHSAYYPARSRYRADTLIRQLSLKTPPGHVTLALTTKDISCTHDKFSDWGIFGLSYCPGNACIASIHCLHNNKEQFFKVAIHELGHTQGLGHCPVKTCFMRDAEGKNHTNEEKEFCPKCKNVLLKAGWLI